MTTTRTPYSQRVLTTLGRSALIGLAWLAGANGAAAQDVTRPTSTIDVGPTAVGSDSFKAAEFNGLQRKGAFAVGNFDLRGGGRFDTSALRWRLTGADLGVDSRGVYAEVGVQGRYRLTAAYDGIRRNKSDSFQMPFVGGGTNVLSLPGSWQVPNVAGSAAGNNVTNNNSARGLAPSVATAPYIDTQTGSATFAGLLTPTSAQLARVLGAANADLPLFHNTDAFTTRHRVDVGFDYQFSPQVSFTANLRPEQRSGTKLLGVVTRATGGDISATIPDLIDTTTTQMTSNLTFTSKRGFATAGYYGSYFRNAVPFMQWDNWAIGPGGAGKYTTQISSTPNTDYSQFKAAGGFTKSATTRLTVDASYGRNTQNDAFLKNDTTFVPASSLNGLVINTALNARFSTKPTKKLTAIAAYKYDYRDNQTPVGLYQFMDADQPLAANAGFPAGPNNPLGALLTTNGGANRHINTKRNTVTGDLDLAISPGQWLKGGYEFQQIDRHCPGTWITCANVATTQENQGNVEWRMRFGQTTARAAYTYSTRTGSDYNENAFLALTPYANVAPVGVTGNQTYADYLKANNLNGWGPALGFFPSPTGNAAVFFPNNSEAHLTVYGWENRIAELPGMRRYDVADRNRQKVRTGLDWAANDVLSIQGDVDYNFDDFTHSRYGLQDSKTLGGTVDMSLSFETVTANVFYSYEDLHSHSAGNSVTNSSNALNVNGATGLSGNSICNSFTTLQERNNNAKLDPCLNWTSDRRDKVHSVGLGLEKQIGNLALNADVVVSRADSNNTPKGGNYVNNPQIGPGAPATNIAAFYIPATAFPTVYTDTEDARLSGTYQIRLGQQLRVQYSFQRMNSDDWIYENMQIGAGTIINVLPSNEQPYKYRVHSFGIGYVFSF